ncbi:MPN domain-containing protein CG4751 [Pararge aegeria]|uniref:Jg9406 protein n=3 Tax=Pararge aegeria TaxID=116150 RepID=A0A8S4S6W3_9NEOP|nr:MPN domain-containing protein CG4751 [Pararge aegeria]CAH2243518.1 jg9406 [Pararge aegeria aegeria]
MEMPTSHLAAALMSGNSTFNTPQTESQSISAENAADEKKEKPTEAQKGPPYEDKEELASGEDFSDEESEAQPGSKSMPGRGVTLQMLLEEKMLEPGTAAMTIEYLGQKFVGDLQVDGKIKSHETETIFCSPSAWAIHCKRIINPDKRSGCGWASVKYKGKKLDTIKATYLRKKQLQRENMHTDEETEMEVESPPEPPPQRIVTKHNTVPNRMMQHDANMLIEAISFSSAGKVQPFLVTVSSNALLVLDIHCHLKKEEVYGYLAGTWDLNNHNMMITHTFPCLISKNDKRPKVFVELEIQMEIEKLGLTLLGWYHSHPTNPAMPSLRDCDNQLEYQIKMRGPSEISYIPCIGVICSPYNPESPVLESSLTFFWVMPPPEQRPTEYPRPLLLQYNMVNDSHLSTHAMEEIKKSIKYYITFTDDAFVNFKDSYKPDIAYLDKLKCTLTPKFPREQSDGLLWHFIRDELGCSSEHDDKMDLDALLAVPQQIPSSKPNPTTIPNFPSVSTLQQMVSRPAGVPPINVSSAMGSGSPHKFETPPLNIPVLPTSSKSSKSSTPSLPPSYPTGLDMLTSMALGLGSANMPLPMGTAGLESLAAANSMLAGFSPAMSSNLAASLSSSKLPDLPSYAASLQNLTSGVGNYEKTSTSTSTSCTTSASPIPANIASNLMMSSADIANALFSASKYSSAGILGIPDPMSKSTLAANNMFLSPSLLKMQESLLKPLSSSSPIPSKVGIDQNMLMKSPHDLIKGSKDYLPPDFSSISKGKDSSLDSMKHSDVSVSKAESSKSIMSESQATDYPQISASPRLGGDPFLNQMLELTKKTTIPDYASDYSQSRKITEEDMQKISTTSLSYSSAASIADTIAQVAMGNFGKLDDAVDYSKSQDYTTKSLNSESDN